MSCPYLAVVQSLVGSQGSGLSVVLSASAPTNDESQTTTRAQPYEDSPRICSRRDVQFQRSVENRARVAVVQKATLEHEEELLRGAVERDALEASTHIAHSALCEREMVRVHERQHVLLRRKHRIKAEDPATSEALDLLYQHLKDETTVEDPILLETVKARQRRVAELLKQRDRYTEQQQELAQRRRCTDSIVHACDSVERARTAESRAKAEERSRSNDSMVEQSVQSALAHNEQSAASRVNIIRERNAAVKRTGHFPWRIELLKELRRKTLAASANLDHLRRGYIKRAQDLVRLRSASHLSQREAQDLSASIRQKNVEDETARRAEERRREEELQQRIRSAEEMRNKQKRQLEEEDQRQKRAAAERRKEARERNAQSRSQRDEEIQRTCATRENYLQYLKSETAVRRTDEQAWIANTAESLQEGIRVRLSVRPSLRLQLDANSKDRESKQELHRATVEARLEVEAAERRIRTEQFLTRNVASASRQRELEMLREERNEAAQRRSKARYVAQKESNEVAQLRKIMVARNHVMQSRVQSLMVQEVVTYNAAVDRLAARERIERMHENASKCSFNLKRRTLERLYGRPRGESRAEPLPIEEGPPAVESEKAHESLQLLSSLTQEGSALRTILAVAESPERWSPLPLEAAKGSAHTALSTLRECFGADAGTALSVVEEVGRSPSSPLDMMCNLLRNTSPLRQMNDQRREDQNTTKEDVRQAPVASAPAVAAAPATKECVEWKPTTANDRSSPMRTCNKEKMQLSPSTQQKRLSSLLGEANQLRSADVPSLAFPSKRLLEVARTNGTPLNLISEAERLARLEKEVEEANAAAQAKRLLHAEVHHRSLSIPRTLAKTPLRRAMEHPPVAHVSERLLSISVAQEAQRLFNATRTSSA